MRDMRRIQKQMNDEDAFQVLLKGEFGILSTINEGGQPYGTPLNYVVYDNSIYFHCALEGSKLDNILVNSRVCFTVVGKTNVLSEKFTTEYESVICFGNAKIVHEEEKELALKKLIEKYSPDFIEAGEEYIKRAVEKTCVVKIIIEHITGKHNI